MRAPILATATVALLATAAAADSDVRRGGSGSARLTAGAAEQQVKVWRGRTRQGKRIIVRVAADGLVELVRIGWRSRCSNGRKLSGRTRFVRPFDQATARSFVDEGSYSVPIDGPLSARDTVHIRGRLARNGPWRGAFRIRSVFRRDGRVIGRCRLRGVSWTARRVR